MNTVEVNFDGLAGPTHNYAGLSTGNLASTKNSKMVSNPKAAAKQGLFKMKALHDLGLVQGILAPQERPDMQTLRKLGFHGSDGDVLKQAYQDMPELFYACMSASSMWAANSATVSPGSDTQDKRVHFTPANLASKFHRTREVDTTARLFKAIFADSRHFTHHDPLPSHPMLGDEGAANHLRLCSQHGQPGVELFVYGRQFNSTTREQPKKFVARQTLEASQCIARMHRLDPRKVIFAQQNPDVIDQGAFHNDVVAVANQNVLFHHEMAFADTDKLYGAIRKSMNDCPMHFIKVANDEISVQTAVNTYLFNTQLVTLPSGSMMLIAPEECRQDRQVASYLDHLVSQDNPVENVSYLDIKQSMQNGGGPACLRLRVVLNSQELAAVNPSVLMSEALFEQLDQWVDKHYRDKLSIEDLKDPQLLTESQSALDELTQICNLGSIYPFQRS